MAKRTSGKQHGKDSSQGLRLLFIHQNFPSPFVHIARHYAANPHNVVAAVGQKEHLHRTQPVPGALLFGYPGALVHARGEAPTGIGALTQDFEQAVRRSKAAKTVYEELAAANFTPDCIIGDPAWGEMLFVRQVFPHTPILVRAECYFDITNPLWDIDPESLYSAATREALCTGQMAALRGWSEATWRYSATHAQRATFPPLFQSGIDILHEGVRTDVHKPGPACALTLPSDAAMHTPDNAPLPHYVPRREHPVTLNSQTELVVYFSRVLEPHRGYHTFMRALPAILQRCPKAHCVIVGRSHGSYGPTPYDVAQEKNAALYGENATWRDIFLAEVRSELDFSRVHFMGNVSDATALALMQRARAFVAPSCMPFPSWSPLEAMACGAPLITTDSVQMREMTNNGKAALLTNFFDAKGLADAVAETVGNAGLRHRLAAAGRAFMRENYDFATVCLPRWNATIQRLVAPTITEA